MRAKLAGLVLACAAALVMTASTSAITAIRSVDNTNPSCNDATGSPVYCSIQAAVNASSPGDTVSVAAGTYHELVNVNKPLTLNGAKHGITALDPSRGTGETVVDGLPTGTGRTTSFYVTANDVTLDGFTVQGATSTTQFGFGILLGAGTQRAHVQGNIVQDNIAGLGLGGDSAQILENVFRDNNEPGPASGTGIYSDQFVAGGSLQKVTIGLNLFANNSDSAIALSSSDPTNSANGVTVANNLFDGNGRAFFGSNVGTSGTSAGPSSIDSNEIQSSTGAATSDIRLVGGRSISIADNLMKNGAGGALRVTDAGSSATLLSFQHNGVTGYASPTWVTVSNFTSPLGTTFDAGFNYWGTSDPVVVASRIAGTVDFNPLLDNGDADPGTRGFQFDKGSLTVHTLGSQYFASQGRIQEAVDALPTTIHVAAGTYAETTTIDTPLSLLGAQAGVDARGRTATESILDGSSGGATPLTITSFGSVVVDGFEIQNATATGAAGIVATPRTSPFSGTTQILNTILTGNRTGLRAATQAQVLIQRDVFDRNGESGVRVPAGSSASTSIAVHDSEFTGNAGSGLTVEAGAYTGTLDAECNWWNSPSGPTNASNPGGTGDAVVGSVDFTPWRTAAGPTGPCGGGTTPSLAATGSYSTYGRTDSQAVTVPNVPNRILVLVFSGKVGGDSLGSATYGGTPLQLLAARNQGSVHLELRYLVNPPAGTAQLAWTKTGANQNVVWGYSVYQGVDQATPWGTAASAGGTNEAATAKSLVVNAQSGELVVDGVVVNGPNGVGTGPIAGAGQAQRWSRRLSTTQGGSSDKPAASPVTMTWAPSSGTGNGIDWALIGAPLKPASGGGGPKPSTTSTQSSTTASNVAPGTSVTDTATVSGSGATPTGTVTFFLCQPATVTANGGTCSTGGAQVGAAKPLDGSGHATSDATTSTTTAGTYCWRAVYSGDASYTASSDGGSASECFTVASAPPTAIHEEAAGSFSVYGTSDSQAVTVPSTANRILIFQFAGKVGGDTLGSVTYGGQPLQLLAARDQGSVHLELRYLVDPPVGTAQLAWTKSGAAQNSTWGYTIYSGVDQATPFGAAVQAGATNDAKGPKSVSVATGTGDVVVDAVVINGATVPPAGEGPVSGQTTRWSRHQSTTQGGSSDRAAAGATTSMTWSPAVDSAGGYDWALIAAPLRPA